jgi:hypothetical protein
MCHRLESPVTCPFQPDSIPLAKRVRFGEVQECFLNPLPKDFIREHLYYSGAELKHQQNTDIEAKFDASLSDHEIDPDLVTFRGLEHALSKDGRRQRIKEYVTSVLEVHLEQKEVGYRDTYEIYMVARAQSKGDRKTAQRIAAMDAREAAAIMLEKCSDDDDVSLTSTSVSSSTHSAISASSRRSKKTIRRCVSGVIKAISTNSKNLLAHKSKEDPVKLGMQRCFTV